MKKLILIICLMLPALGQAQTLESVNLVRSGYWQVVSPDTITNHTDAIQAIERQLNLMASGIDPVQIVIKPPLYEVRATFSEAPVTDTVFAYSESDLTRDIRPELQTAFPDTTEFYAIEYSGISKADRIKIVTNCYDSRQNEKYSANLSILADSVAEQRLPSSRALQPGEHYFHHTSPDTLDCRGIAVYWITASTDSLEVVSTDNHIDIGHRLFIGQ